MAVCVVREQPSAAALSHCTMCVTSMLSHQRKTYTCLAATSSCRPNITLMTPTHRDILQLVWHVSSLTHDVVSCQQASALLDGYGCREVIPPRSGHEVKDLTSSTGSEKESADSVAMTTNICNNVLQIAGFVTPDTTASAPCLFLFHWCLNQATQQFPSDLALYVSLLTWMKATVVASDTIRRQLLSDTPLSRHVVEHLLNTYSAVRAASLSSLPDTLEISRSMVLAGNKLLNEMFLSIFDEVTSAAMCLSSDMVVRLKKTLMRKSIKAAFSGLSGRHVSSTHVGQLDHLLGELIIETWLNADSPRHVMDGSK